MTLSFQPAGSQDLDMLMQYMRDFHDFDHTTPFDTDAARTAMKTVVENKTIGRVWLIAQSKETVGYMVLTLAYRLEYRGYYAFLDELFIRADKRGQGIGRAALAFLKTACKGLNVSWLQLEVKNNNSAAGALYEKAGFEEQQRNVFLQHIR